MVIGEQGIGDQSEDQRGRNLLGSEVGGALWRYVVQPMRLAPQ